MAKIITMINNKGGIGKTSSCTTIGTILGILGYKCLIVDNDFQSNTTATLLTETDRIDGTIVDLFTMDEYDKASFEHSVIHTAYANVDLVPACPEHVDTNDFLHSLPKDQVNTKLKRALDLVQDDYDFIIIDTHPDLYATTKNALYSSDYVMTPVGADGYSFQGTAPIANFILNAASEAGADNNPDLVFLGAFITNAEVRTSLYKNYYSFYQEQLGEDFIPICIRRDSAIGAVPSWLIPLPYLLGYKDYRATAKWKGIYDYIDLMREIGMITEYDYVLARSIFEVADGNFLLNLKKVNGEVEISSVTLAKGVRDDFQNEYVAEHSYSYKNLVNEVNNNEDLRRDIKKGVITTMDEDRIIKIIPHGDKRTPYIKVKGLK